MVFQRSNRTGYFREDGVWVKGTVVKPRYFGQNLVVDKNDKRTSAIKVGRRLRGRQVDSHGDHTLGIKVKKTGYNIGRTKSLKTPFPKAYPVFERVGTQRSGKGIYKIKKVKLVNWNKNGRV